MTHVHQSGQRTGVTPTKGTTIKSRENFQIQNFFQGDVSESFHGRRSKVIKEINAAIIAVVLQRPASRLPATFHGPYQIYRPSSQPALEAADRTNKGMRQHGRLVTSLS